MSDLKDNSYVNKVYKKANTVFDATTFSLEELKNRFKYYKTCLSNFSLGTTSIELRKRYMLKVLDEEWLNKVEDALPYIDTVIRSPGSTLQEYEELKPVELTRKVTNRSVIHLSQHTDLINKINEDGTVIPSKLLNVYQDDTMFTYENKFMNTLMERLYSFVMIRYDAALACGEDEKNTCFSYKQEFEEGDRKGIINVSIEVSDPPKEGEVVKNHIYSSDLWRRVEKIKQWIEVIMSSKFIKDMGKQFIRPPVMKTNKLMKNVELNQCLQLWEFIENYENTGYQTIVQESLEGVEDEFIKNFNNAVIAQYILFNKSITNDFVEDSTLDSRTSDQFSPQIKDELDPFTEREYDYRDLIPDKAPEEKIEKTGKEDDIDFALQVALAADDQLFKEDEDFIAPFRFSYSFLGRLIIAQNPCQDYYTAIKNELLSYQNVKTNISWKHELFKIKREKFAKLMIKGKTLCIFLPLNPEEYQDSKYKFKDVGTGSNEDTPFMMKITSERMMRWAIELIGVAAEKLGLTKIADFKPADYHRAYKTPIQLCKLKNPLAKLLFGELPEDETQIEFKYVYSFLGRLNLAQEPAQTYYTELKNRIMSYPNIIDSITWKHELFRVKKTNLARFVIKGKTLVVYLPLDPERCKTLKIPYSVVSDKKEFASLPIMFKVKSDRSLKHLLNLIDEVMANNEFIKPVNFKKLDYHMDLKTVDELRNMVPPLVKLIDEKIETPVFNPKMYIKKKEISIAGNDYSFLGRLIVAQEPTQSYYSELKNHLLSFNKVKSLVSWRKELFKLGRITIAKFVMTGKTLKVYLNLNPDAFSDAKYVFEDTREKFANTDLPLLMRITSLRKMTDTKELIDVLAQEMQLEPLANFEAIDYHMPYQSAEELARLDPPLVKLGDGGDIDIPEKEVEEVKVEEPKVEEVASKEEVKEEIAEPEIKEEVKVDAPTKKGLNIIGNDYSFLGRLIVAQEPAQTYYSDLKNRLLSYENIKCLMSWRKELFKVGRSTIAKFVMTGKTLKVFLSLDPNEYADSKYVFEDLREKNPNADLPFLMRMTSQRKFTDTLELIDEIAKKLNLAAIDNFVSEDYHRPYQSPEELAKLDPPLVKLGAEEDEK